MGRISGPAISELSRSRLRLEIEISVAYGLEFLSTRLSGIQGPISGAEGRGFQGPLEMGLAMAMSSGRAASGSRLHLGAVVFRRNFLYFWCFESETSSLQ